MARHKPTNPDTPDWTPTPQQETAVDLLASGKTLTDTAKALEVTRQTVSEWFNHHPGFQAALNSRRQELWAELIDSIRGLLPQAITVLAKELAGEAPLPAAVQVLKLCGFYGQIGAPIGPSTVADAEQAQRRQALERARSCVTDEDVRLAEQARQEERELAALSALP